jgi:hypothetical protein
MFSLSLNRQAFQFRIVETMKPEKGQVQESGRENAFAVSAPNLGGLVRQIPQYFESKYIDFPKS